MSVWIDMHQRDSLVDDIDPRPGIDKLSNLMGVHGRWQAAPDVDELTHAVALGNMPHRPPEKLPVSYGRIDDLRTPSRSPGRRPLDPAQSDPSRPARRCTPVPHGEPTIKRSPTICRQLWPCRLPVPASYIWYGPLLGVIHPVLGDHRPGQLRTDSQQIAVRFGEDAISSIRA